MTTPVGAVDSDKAGSRPLIVCLVGMPNSGKTTLMNALTGGHFHTANYPGVTVSLLQGKSRPQWGSPITFVDLPGVHSPVNPSAEEELSCRVIESRHASVEADAFALVVDATQLERHLKFAGFVARQGKPIVLILTMMDLLDRVGQDVDPGKLSETLGLPVMAVDSRHGKGVPELVAELRNVAHREMGHNALADLGDEPIEAYRRVRELLRASDTLVQPAGLEVLVERDSLTAGIDRIALHRYLGFPIFLVVLVALFASIFWLATPFMNMVESVFAVSGNFVTGIFPRSLPARFVSEGLIGGVGAVAVFFPQIVILFFLMTLLEDSGYLARGATLVDRPLSALGLHGRSFVPMLSGFACAIPAVFASRSIPTLRERLLTIWIIPLMSCSARLPVYALLLAVLMPDAAGRAGLILASIYIASLLIGSLSAGIVGRIAFPNQAPSMLAMELPVYRVPRWKVILRITWSRSSSYLRKAGVPIVVIAIILWLLSNFGLGSAQPQFAGATNPPMIVQSEMDSSLAAQLGREIEPVLSPMGVDWRVGVGLISAFAAREVFVSAMAIVFHVEGEDEDSQVAGLRETMRTATFADTGEPIFTTASMIGLIVFFFFSLQCIATVAVVRKETNSWRFAAIQLVFYTGLGYLAAVGTVQGLRWIGVA
jgi:ferrous iron transport protein B